MSPDRRRMMLRLGSRPAVGKDLDQLRIVVHNANIPVLLRAGE